MAAACKKIAFCDKYIYFVVERQGSTTRSKLTEKYIYDYLEARLFPVNLTEKNYPNLLDLSKANYIRAIIFCVRLTLKDGNSKKLYLELKNELKKTYKNFSKNNKCINVKIKIGSFFISKLSYQMAAVAYRILVR